MNSGWSSEILVLMMNFVHTGNADGIGEVRKKELSESGRILGLRSDDDVLVLDLP